MEPCALIKVPQNEKKNYKNHGSPDNKQNVQEQLV